MKKIFYLISVMFFCYNVAVARTNVDDAQIPDNIIVVSQNNTCESTLNTLDDKNNMQLTINCTIITYWDVYWVTYYDANGKELYTIVVYNIEQYSYCLFELTPNPDY